MVGEPDGTNAFGRPRRWWEDNIKINLKWIGYKDVDWIRLVHDRVKRQDLVNTVFKLH